MYIIFVLTSLLASRFTCHTSKLADIVTGLADRKDISTSKSKLGQK